ncbi:MAG: hypothetical protein M3P18_25545 [Actinomycetota bacterium]|nr:hypothetical protein [Actinomycetota bacterium]
MLDRGFRATFHHFSTLFFLVAAVTVPLHLVYVFAFHGVIAVRELAPQIQRFPPSRQVHGVGPAQIQHGRVGMWVVDGLELLLLPLAIRAAREVVAVDDRGEIPTVVNGWRSALHRQHGSTVGFEPGLLIAAVVALAVGSLLEGMGRVLAEPFGTSWTFVVIGLTQGCARAAGAAFLLGPAAVTSSPSTTHASRGALP